MASRMKYCTSPSMVLFDSTTGHYARYVPMAKFNGGGEFECFAMKRDGVYKFDTPPDPEDIERLRTMRPNL